MRAQVAQVVGRKTLERRHERRCRKVVGSKAVGSKLVAARDNIHCDARQQRDRRIDKPEGQNCHMKAMRFDTQRLRENRLAEKQRQKKK